MHQPPHVYHLLIGKHMFCVGVFKILRIPDNLTLLKSCTCSHNTEEEITDGVNTTIMCKIPVKDCSAPWEIQHSGKKGKDIWLKASHLDAFCNRPYCTVTLNSN